MSLERYNCKCEGCSARVGVRHCPNDVLHTELTAARDEIARLREGLGQINNLTNDEPDFEWMAGIARKLMEDK